MKNYHWSCAYEGNILSQGETEDDAKLFFLSQLHPDIDMEVVKRLARILERPPEVSEGKIAYSNLFI